MTLIRLPLVVPPVVFGFYFLLLFSPQFLPGRLFETVFGSNLLFSFPALIVVSSLYTFPFMFSPIVNGFKRVDMLIIEKAVLMGKSKPVILVTVILPIIKNEIISASGTVFAHVMGQYGLVLMVGGNIAGQTKTASIAIYEEIEKMNYQGAFGLSIALTAISILILTIIQFFNSRKQVSQ